MSGGDQRLTPNRNHWNIVSENMRLHRVGDLVKAYPPYGGTKVCRVVEVTHDDVGYYYFSIISLSFFEKIKAWLHRCKIKPAFPDEEEKT